MAQDDWEDDFEEYEDYPPLPRSRTKSSPRNRKKSSRKKKPSMVVQLAVGIPVFIVFAILGFMVFSKLVGGGNSTASSSNGPPSLEESEEIVAEALQITRECTALINSIRHIKPVFGSGISQSKVDQVNDLNRRAYKLEEKMMQYPLKSFDYETAKALAPKYQETLKKELDDAWSLSWAFSSDNPHWSPSNGGLSTLRFVQSLFWQTITKKEKNEEESKSVGK